MRFTERVKAVQYRPGNCSRAFGISFLLILHFSLRPGQRNGWFILYQWRICDTREFLREETPGNQSRRKGDERGIEERRAGVPHRRDFHREGKGMSVTGALVGLLMILAIFLLYFRPLSSPCRIQMLWSHSNYKERISDWRRPRPLLVPPPRPSICLRLPFPSPRLTATVIRSFAPLNATEPSGV